MAEKELEDYSDSEIEEEFFARKNIDGTMVNEMKVEKFFHAINDFTIEQFEEFLKDKTP